jgi:ATP/maltotriose-dependent transcriptional regulator MalT
VCFWSFHPAAPTKADQSFHEVEMISTRSLANLRQTLTARFSADELRTLCFDLGIDSENLPGEGKAGKARELLLYLERYDRIPELIECCRQSRPDVPWDDLLKEERPEMTPSRFEPLPELELLPDVTGFVGRQAELAAYRRRLDQSHLAVITGMRGAGKTWLAARLATQVGTAGRIFWRTLYPGDGIGSVVRRLAGFLARLGQDGPWRMWQSTQQPGHAAPKWDELFDNLIRAACRQHILLCLDDFHHLDRDPQIGGLVDRLRGVVAAGEMSLIITSQRMPDFVFVEELPGISLEDMRLLLTAKQMALPERLASDLLGRAGGNLELLTLAINALRDHPDPAALIAGLAHQGSVEHFIMTQVDKGLSEDEKDVMNAVSVLLGLPGAQEAVEAVLDKSSIRKALDDLTQCYLLTIHRSKPQEEFSQHPVVQEFYYRRLGRQRRELHLRAGEYYETKERVVLRAVQHYIRAEAFEHTLRLIGEAPEFPGENDQALAAYQQLMAALQKTVLSGETRHLAGDVARRIGRLYGWKGQMNEAHQWIEKARERLAAPQDQPERDTLALVDIHTASLHIERGEFPKAEALCQGALAMLGETSAPAVQAEGYLLLGAAQDMQGKGQDALISYQRSLDLWKRLGDDFAAARVENNIAVVHSYLGHLPRAREMYERALRFFEETAGDRNRAAVALMNLGNIEYILGDYETAASRHRRARNTPRAWASRAWRQSPGSTWPGFTWSRQSGTRPRAWRRRASSSRPTTPLPNSCRKPTVCWPTSRWAATGWDRRDSTRSAASSWHGNSTTRSKRLAPNVSWAKSCA